MQPNNSRSMWLIQITPGEIPSGANTKHQKICETTGQALLFSWPTNRIGTFQAENSAPATWAQPPKAHGWGGGSSCGQS